MRYIQFVNDIRVENDVYDKIINKAIKLEVQYIIHIEHYKGNDYTSVQLDIPIEALLDLIIYDDKINLNKNNDNS